MANNYAGLRSLLLCGTLFISTPALAQITPDNTLGAENSRLTPNVTINGASADRIDGGAARGSNLFHSFSDFNIDDGQRVYFGNPNGIQNILTRVTGKNASSILGTLGVDGGANLFLLNPNGIIFGQNARLDLRGSFVGTTANAIAFGEQGFFSATDPQAPPLLTVNPSALLYTQINGGAIANQGSLTAQTGQSLVLAGGDIDFNSGSMTAVGGRIELAAIAGTGTIGLNPDNSLSIPTDLPRADIALSNSQIGVTAGNNSGVAIHARNLDISGNSIIYSQIGSDVEAVNPKAGDISLDATGTVQIRQGSLITNYVAEGESGKGGNINVTTGSLSLSDGAEIYASTFGEGDAGSVFVQALDSVSAAGNSYIQSNVEGGAKGNGGDVNITAPTLSLTDGGQLSTIVREASQSLPAGEGNAGDVNVNVSRDVTISGVKDDATSGIFSYLGEGAKGKGGNINITTGSLSLTDGAQLKASTGGTGDAGSVLVQASDFVSAAGNSYIQSNVEGGAKGNGGNVNITAPTLSLTDGGQVGTFVRKPSQSLPAGEGNAGDVNVNVSGDVTISGVKDGFPSGIFSYLGEGAKGKGGSINITTGSLSLTDGALLEASTRGTGDAGSVLVQASDFVSAAGNSKIFSNVEGGAKGKGGNINITTGSLSLSDGAGIDASTFGTGDAGSVFVQATDSVFASNGDIFSNVESGAVGNGGNINITAPTLSLTDSSQLGTFVRKPSQSLPAGAGNAGDVNVNVSGDVTISGVKNGYSSGIFSYLGEGAKGKGGSINITTGSLSLTDGALLEASTRGTGDAGSVSVQATDSVFASNGGIFSNVEGGAKGKGGNINITTGSLSLTDGAQLKASTGGTGDAGSVLVQASDFVSAAGNSYIQSNVEGGAKGNGGNVNITAPTLSLTDGGQVGTFVREPSQSLPAGEGNAGDVNVNVSGDVTISGVKDGFPSGIFSYLGEGAKGKGGSINITTGSLSLTDGALLEASTRGTGDAGSVLVQASDFVSAAGNSKIFSNVEGGAKGKGGNINITTGSLSLSDGAGIDASTFGTGDAGSVFVQATDSVSAAGNSKIFSNVEGGAKGNGGNVNITAPTLSLTDGGQVGTFVRKPSQSLPAGEGNAGDVNVNVSGDVTISGVKDGFPSGIFSYLGEGAKGKGGSINITTGSLSLTDGALLEASTRGTGDAGSVFVQASDFVSIAGNSNITSDVAAGAKGNGGNVNITAPTLSLTDGGQLSTSVNKTYNNLPAGEGIGGNVFVNVSGDVTISGVKNTFPSGIFSTLETGAKGNGGSINVTTGSLSLTDGARIYASTYGTGDAGSVFVQATDSVSASNGDIFSNVESGAVGNGGNINITAPTLSLTDASQLGTFVREASNNLPAGQGIAGNVNVNVSGVISISGVKDGFSSGIFSYLEKGTKGKGGNINVTTGSLSVTDGATLTASTLGEGDAGNIQINATDRVSVSGTSSSSGYSSALFTNTFPVSTGIGGDIAVNTNVLRVSDGAVLNAGTRNDRNGGNITVNARQVEAINGGQFLTSTSGSGNAGKITLNATEQVIVNGSDPTFDDRVAKFGDIANPEAASGFFVRSQGSGIAGDIEVTSPQIRLDNGGRLIAESASGNGGDINIINSDLLLLRRNSTISTNAGQNRGAGNGGNITINAKTIAAVPNENSDITAKAFSGRGGNVTINTDGLFGIVKADFSIPQSDITASSELGVQGQINITEPNVQPTQGLVELPVSVLDASDQIAQTCPSGTSGRSLGEFVVTGRGGSLPPNPIEPLAGTTSISPLASLDGETQTNISSQKSEPASTATPTTIVEAQGWVKTPDGKIALVASAPSATPNASTTQATCPVSR